MRGRVRVLGVARQPGRCAYCHDDLGAIGQRCVECGTWLHVDCWRELNGCPTQGCGERGPSLAAAPPPQRTPEQHAQRVPLAEDADLLAWARLRTERPRSYQSYQVERLVFVVLGLLLTGALAAAAGATFLMVPALHESRPVWALVLALPVVCCLILYVGLRWILDWREARTAVERLETLSTPVPMRMRVWHELEQDAPVAFGELVEVRAPDASGPRRRIRRLRLGSGRGSGWLVEPRAGVPVLLFGLDHDLGPPFLLLDAQGNVALLDPWA